MYGGFFGVGGRMPTFGGAIPTLPYQGLSPRFANIPMPGPMLPSYYQGGMFGGMPHGMPIMSYGGIHRMFGGGRMSPSKPSAPATQPKPKPKPKPKPAPTRPTEKEGPARPADPAPKKSDYLENSPYKEQVERAKNIAKQQAEQAKSGLARGFAYQPHMGMARSFGGFGGYGMF